MKIQPLGIEDAWAITPAQHTDERGVFAEVYRFDHLAAAVGHPLRLAQANMSVSKGGVVRGIHYADVPPGQAKYVICTLGAVLDVIVDIRIGSPNFGEWVAVQLDDVDRHAVYLGEGLGHAFCALTGEATLVYLCSETYAPQRERALNPLDPDLAIRWPIKTPILSPRDADAPCLAAAKEAGLLPDFAVCAEYTRSLRTG